MASPLRIKHRFVHLRFFIHAALLPRSAVANTAAGWCHQIKVLGLIPAAESLRIAEPNGRLTGSIGWPARSAFCCTSFRAAPDVMAPFSLGRHAEKPETLGAFPCVRSWRTSGLVDGAGRDMLFPGRFASHHQKSGPLCTRLRQLA